MLPSYASHQNLAVTLRRKRKLVAFNMVPWHKEINNDQLWPQDISTAELSWAQAANKREEEVISEAEIVEELHPVIQAKRRSDSHDKPETSRKTGACKFSKVVEDIVCRTKKLEGDLMSIENVNSMMQTEKSLSIVDIKVEAQEMEKFSTINRFAKFHIRAQPSSVGSETSSSTSTLHKTHPQRYVAGHPMPNILPESVDCLCL
ncbi:hypothetical protein SASPL_157517 [Salvia splendens]|uniref:Uncharacterized protein n=1 Tax=Salvia splendens TaxID=180675 RepID=A0A8X8VUR5_SALSN|nr:hypothetical protein SASPL_157517 [Salvia splendens]